MQNGRVSGSIVGGFPVNGAGGCIFLRNGSLTLVDSVLQECTALGLDDATGRSAGAWGGAIAAVAGTLVIRDSSFGFNRATGGAALAAGFPGAMGDGGAIFATGLDSLVIERSNISSNVATGGAGVTRAGNGRGGGLDRLRHRDQDRPLVVLGQCRLRWRGERRHRRHGDRRRRLRRGRSHPDARRTAS